MKKTLLILLFLVLKINAQDTSIESTRLDDLGKKIESTLSEGDGDYINSIYDLEEMSKRFLVNDTKSKKIKKYNASFYGGFSESFNFGNIITTQIENGASYQYLKQIKEDNDYYLLFRLFGDGLNYHKHLVKEIDGELKIIDSYIYLSGEFFSDTFKNLYTGLLASQGLLSSKNNSNKESFKDLFKIKEIKTLLAQGKKDKAEKIYTKISEESKKQKIYKIIGLQLSSNLSEDKYNKAILDYEQAFPDDISLYLISIDGYIINENYDKALTSINKLDELIGGDAFLNYLRGNIFYLKTDLESAEKNFLKMTKDYPEYMDSFDSLLSLYIEKNDNESAINMLDKMVNDFYIPKPLLFESLKENYKEFSKKEEVVKWSKE